LTPRSGQRAVEHFEGIGMKAKLLASPEASEIAKLTETTYFGLLIAWAQEVERYCTKLGANYDEVVSFYDEIKFFPQVKYFPGEIGGHCVMPNIAILSQQFPSGLCRPLCSRTLLSRKSWPGGMARRKSVVPGPTQLRIAIKLQIEARLSRPMSNPESARIFIEDSLNRVERWVEGQNYRGYEPFDGLSLLVSAADVWHSFGRSAAVTADSSMSH